MIQNNLNKPKPFDNVAIKGRLTRLMFGPPPPPKPLAFSWIDETCFSLICSKIMELMI